MQRGKSRWLLSVYLSWAVAGLLQTVMASPPKPIEVYLLIGQSNMAGRAPLTETTSQPLDRCLLLNTEGAWIPAQAPLNIHSSIRKGPKMQRVGPGDGFARAMTARAPAVTLGLVVNAKGGTRIEQWAKGTPFYEEAVRRTREAIAQGGTLAGILWHQGESNQNNPEAYLETLAQLIQDLRTDLDAPKLPFVAGQISKDSAINAHIARLPQVVPHTAYVSSAGLTTYDGTHFDTASAELLGQRYADAIGQLQAARE